MSFEENFEKVAVSSSSKQDCPLPLATAANEVRKLYLESYGCAMNFSDSEIIASIMKGIGFTTTDTTDDADVIFLNTCAIRENAELKIWARLKDFRAQKRRNPDLIIGVLGCMAERLKTTLLEKEKLVDMVVGPDSYRDLPNLVAKAETGQKAVNVLLSRDETYAEVSPVRLGSNGISAFISITRGCDNMCSFCVVPFTRGRERSRDPQTIVDEARQLFENGYKEVTLLGQNVDSYLWHPDSNTKKDILSRPDGRWKMEDGSKSVLATSGFQLPSLFVTFADLLELVAKIHPDLRVQFSTSNPRDMTDAVVHVIARHDNICNYIHLPVQSGSSVVLERMNRGYSREDYMKRIETIRNIIPDCRISSDIISGFCGETEEDHRETLTLMEWVGYDYSYMFKYSERPGTAAAKKFKDDVPEEVKARRLQEIIDMQSELSHRSNLKDLNKVTRVLADAVSKRSDKHLSGRNDQNKVVIFPREQYKPGDYVNVLITDCTKATLIGKAIK